MTLIQVTDYTDLQNTDLYDRDKHVLLEYLREHEHATVFYIPEWLAEEKPFESIAGSKFLFHGEVMRETEKAVEVNQVSREDWLPKSQITWFEREDGFTGEMPQRGLTDYE